MRPQYFALGLTALCGAVAANPLPGLSNQTSANYRVVVTETQQTSAYSVMPLDEGEALPDIPVNLVIEKPIRFADAVKLMLVDTSISISFSGDLAQAIGGRELTAVKLSGQLKAVISSLASDQGISYHYREGALQFVADRPYVLRFQDAGEAPELEEQIRKLGGKIMSSQAERKEILFSARLHTYRRIKNAMKDRSELARNPSQKFVAKTVLAPVVQAQAPSPLGGALPKPMASQSSPESAAVPATKAPLMPAGNVVKAEAGNLTVKWKGDAVALVQNLAQATGKQFGGIEGKERGLMVDVTVQNKPLRPAFEQIGAALGASATLVVRSKELVLRFN